MHLPTQLLSKAPLYCPLALLEVEKDDAEDVSQREGLSSVKAFVHAKAESIKLRDLTFKWVKSSVSKAWFHRFHGSLATDLRNCKPNPKVSYSKATVHRNLTGTRMQVFTACIATQEHLRTLLCIASGACLHNSQKYTTNISALFWYCERNMQLPLHHCTITSSRMLSESKKMYLLRKIVPYG